MYKKNLNRFGKKNNHCMPDDEDCLVVKMNRLEYSVLMFSFHKQYLSYCLSVSSLNLNLNCNELYTAK